jgi:hypothetical protein
MLTRELSANTSNISKNITLVEYWRVRKYRFSLKVFDACYTGKMQETIIDNGR